MTQCELQHLIRKATLLKLHGTYDFPANSDTANSDLMFLDLWKESRDHCSVTVMKYLTLCCFEGHAIFPILDKRC